MKREVVEAVNGQSITTESGEKICIGNHAFDVGESVWVDGRYAFGNDRKAVAPVVHELGEGTTSNVFVWYGLNDNDELVFRIYSAKNFNYVEIAADTFDSFAYNADKFVGFNWDVTGTNYAVTLTVLNADGNTTQTLNSYTDNAYPVDLCVNDDGTVMTSYFANTLECSKHYDTSGNLISNSSGTVKFYDLLDDTLANSTDITSAVISAANDDFTALDALSTTADVKSTKVYDNGPIDEEKVRESCSVWNGDTEVDRATITSWKNTVTCSTTPVTDKGYHTLTSGSTIADNRPSYDNVSLYFIDYKNKIVRANSLVTSKIYHTSDTGQGTFIFGGAGKRHKYIDIYSLRFSKETLFRGTSSEVSYSSHSANTVRQYDSSNIFKCISLLYSGYEYTYVRASDPSKTFGGAAYTDVYYIPSYTLDEEVDNNFTVVANINDGYTITYTSVDEKYILAKGNFSFDITLYMSDMGYTRLCTAAVVSELDNDNLLFVRPRNDEASYVGMYLIKKSNSSITEINTDRCLSKRLPVITMSRSQLISILKSKTSS